MVGSNDSFEQRNVNNKVDRADQSMINYLHSRNFVANKELNELTDEQQGSYAKTGFDPKTNYLPRYWDYVDLWEIPDYIIVPKLSHKTFFSEVKGTNKFKLSDFEGMTRLYNDVQHLNDTIKYRKRYIEVGVFLFLTREDQPTKYLDYEDLKLMWDSIDELKSYPEKDKDGNTKHYKELKI
tara:strand:- start:1682 stop:2224 length:543 start_codon:yes stop_codon:yes gene_type:complete